MSLLQMGRPTLTKEYSGWKDFINKNPDKIKDKIMNVRHVIWASIVSTTISCQSVKKNIIRLMNILSVKMR